MVTPASISTVPDDVEWRESAGLTPYPDAIAAMQERVAGIRAGTAPELVWLLQHPPLYTAGTSAAAGDLTTPDRFPVFQAGRGGQWTYHGPGQRVAYVLLDLTHPHGRVPARDVRCYVNGLQDWLIRTLDRFGVKGELRAGRIGIWVVGAGGAESKIAAIGVRVSRWVSWHGVALNVSPVPGAFQRDRAVWDPWAWRDQPAGARGGRDAGAGGCGVEESVGKRVFGATTLTRIAARSDPRSSRGQVLAGEAGEVILTYTSRPGS